MEEQRAKDISYTDQKLEDLIPTEVTEETLPEFLSNCKTTYSVACLATLSFLKEEHPVDSFQKKENWLLAFEAFVVPAISFFDKIPNEEMSEERKELLREAKELKKSITQLNGRIAQARKDMVQQQKDAEFDLAKLLTFGVGFPALVYNTIKQKDFTVAVCLAGGLCAGGVGFHFRKGLSKAWKETARDLNPKAIKNSIKETVNFNWYYIKTSICELKEFMQSQNDNNSSFEFIGPPSRADQNKAAIGQIRNDLS